MSMRPLEAPRFIRRTQLGANEYRKNFRQIDGDVISAVTSLEADRVTPLMSKIYLRLVHAPSEYWERDGVLRFEAVLRDDGQITAWDTLCEVVGVASATARKALRWMHEQGIIGYFAGKNGVGIRIFLNRAASSIGSRAGQKILAFPRASSGGARTSTDEVAFSDSFADLEVSDTDRNPRAPNSGAEDTGEVKKEPDPSPTAFRHPTHTPAAEGLSSRARLRVSVPIEEIVSRLRCELEPTLQSAARHAAAQEHERTREWLESRGLPKAARVAQREAFNVLRQHGLVSAASRERVALGVGASTQEIATENAHPLAPEEVRELAEMCLAMLEVHGQAIGVTLAELSVEAGGILLTEDTPKVRELAESMAYGGGKE